MWVIVRRVESKPSQDGGISFEKPHILRCGLQIFRRLRGGFVVLDPYTHIARCGIAIDQNHRSRPGDDGIKQMAHTYTNLLFHVVFSTQGHLPLIKPAIRSELFAYMASLIKEKGGMPLIINGVDDHVHMLILLPPDLSLSEAMKFVKANSSRWMKQRFNKPFAWQKGFGAFSVSRSSAGAVSRYIQNQETHHKKQDFREEFVTLLSKNEVDFDENYLWK
jgi:putative transposase